MALTPLEGRTVALGVGGGIAAYRAADLSRVLMKRGATVRVVMTAGAREFITPLTFQALTGQPVLTDLFDPRQDATYGHLDLSRRAELFIVAPATADLLARLRHGMADDPLATSLIATRCAVLLAPAMNTAMWENRQVQENVIGLLSDPRFSMVGPNSGLLADGDIGAGRLAEPHEIADAAEALLARQDLAGRRVVVTAGATREHLDPVRFLSNPSTGRMGFAVARAARQRGAVVVLVSGPSELAAPAGVEVIRVTSAEEMSKVALERARGCDLFVAAAAVADQRPKVRAKQKVKKQDGDEQLTLVRTTDILATASRLAKGPRRPLFVGFAAETEKLEEHAREKLERKNLDLICANDVTAPGSGFAGSSNRLLLIDRSGTVTRLPELSKEAAAHALLDRVLAVAAGLKGTSRWVERPVPSR